jgi:uncharacterized protein YbaA (DUF1428 family)
MKYVQGFLIPVPTAKKEAYRDLAEKAGEIFRKHGVISIVETWGTDVPEGEVTSFPMAVKLKPDETVVFSWMVWRSREVFEAGHMAAMQDFEEAGITGMDLFDGKRMIFGGFEPIYEL